MDKNIKKKLFEESHNKPSLNPTKQDKIELMTEFVNKLMEIVHISELLIEIIPEVEI